MKDAGSFPITWFANGLSLREIQPWFPLPSNLINKGEEWIPEIQGYAGGLQTKDEMCVQILAYYPRMKNLSICISIQSPSALQTMTNNVTFTDMDQFKQWLHNLKWTPELGTKWQEFYNHSSRLVIYGAEGHFQIESIDSFP
ncbi:unnamed protein product [Rotaria sp. Silwood2]|nr:unnamed protein product [Rotaria sp. Silwood2]CAF3947626.1 unnamed protein product [Rotaria sp. Silwood2]